MIENRCAQREVYCGGLCAALPARRKVYQNEDVWAMGPLVSAVFVSTVFAARAKNRAAIFRASQKESLSLPA